jgi:hypothetical protein
MKKTMLGIAIINLLIRVGWMKAPKVTERKSTGKPMPISQTQAQNLLVLVLHGYRELMALNDSTSKVETGKEPGRIFQASAEVKVRNTAYLGQVVNSIFGLKATTEIFVSESIEMLQSFEGMNPSSKQVSAFVMNFHNRTNKVVSDLKKKVDAENAKVSEQARTVIQNLKALEEQVSSKNFIKVKEILESMAGIAEWKTSINLRELYKAAVGIQEIARFNSNYLFEANQIVSDIADGVESVMVHEIKEYSRIDGTPIPYTEGAKVMFGEEIYKGEIDLGIVAGEIIRAKHDKFDHQGSSFEVNPGNN